MREYWIAFPGEQALAAYVSATAGEYEPTATHVAPGPVPSSSLPELVLHWADIFEEKK